MAAISQGEERSFEESPSVRRMRGAISSEQTAKTYTDRVSVFLNWCKLGPEEFIKALRSQEIKIRFKVQDFLTYQDNERKKKQIEQGKEARGIAPSTKYSYYSAIKKFVTENLDDEEIGRLYIEPAFKKVAKNIGKVRPVERDEMPTKIVLRHLLKFANIKDSTLELVAASSGARIGTLTLLRVGDVDFDKFPDIAVIKVPSDKAKGEVAYKTFITPEAREALEAYLEYRRRQGEVITEDSPLFEYGKGQFYSSPTKLGRRWNNLLKKAGVDDKLKGSTFRKYHFHTLKKYFRTSLEYAGVTKSFREELLGHEGDFLDPSYFTPEFDKLVEEYRRAIPYLTIKEVLRETDEEMKLKQLKTFAKSLGLVADIILRKEMAVEEQIESLNEAIKNAVIGKRPQKEQQIVEESELSNHLSHGWRVVQVLASGKVVVERG